MMVVSIFQKLLTNYVIVTNAFFSFLEESYSKKRRKESSYATETIKAGIAFFAYVSSDSIEKKIAAGKGWVS